MPPGWLQIASPLRTAGLISIVASFIAALFISTVILRPIAPVTASPRRWLKAIINQQIEVRGLPVRSPAHRLPTRWRAGVAVEPPPCATSWPMSPTSCAPLTAIEGFSEAILDGTAHDVASPLRESALVVEDAHRIGWSKICCTRRDDDQVRSP